MAKRETHVEAVKKAAVEAALAATAPKRKSPKPAGAKAKSKRTRASEPSKADLERELKVLHTQMAESLERIESLLEHVSDEHRTMARSHLRRFHSEQKRHLEHIRRKLAR